MQSLVSHSTDFYEDWYLRIFRNSGEKIQFLLQSDQKNGYVTRTPTWIYDNNSLRFFRMRNISDKSCRERTRSLAKIHVLSGRANRQSYRVCLRKPMVTKQELVCGYLTLLLLLNQVPSTTIFCLLSLRSKRLEHCLPYCPHQISFRLGHSLLRCRYEVICLQQPLHFLFQQS
jgi:hypothetical protein